MMGCNGNHYRRGGTLPLSYTFHGETNNTRYLHMRREQILNTALQMLIIVNQLKVPLPLYNLIL
jgi:hypothetical protein